MKSLFRHIILIIGFVLAGPTVFQVPVWGGEAGDAAPPAEIEADAEALLLVDLINAARRDPLGTAEILGMNTAKIMADFPELAEILTSGLPELRPNQRLFRSAQKHTADMLANNYYAYESSDGRTLRQRMNQEGYVVVFSGESLGLLFFTNFISPETAVGRIFANMYRDELDPVGSGVRNILNPDVLDIGATLGGGIYNFNGYTGNVYLATCDFGAEVGLRDMELFLLINQIRSKPKQVLEVTGYDYKKILNDYPELKETCFSKNGCPPLTFSPQLYNAAKHHVWDMIENEYISSKSLDGRTPEVRISDAGYEADWSAESQARVAGASVRLENEKAVSAVFRRLLSKAFHGVTPDQLLFSTTARECGTAIGSGEYLYPDDMLGNYVTMGVVEWASPLIPSVDPVISGVVFADQNNNAIYDAGEGVPDISIEIRRTGGGMTWNVVTDSAGGFSLPVSSGRYRLRVDRGDDAYDTKWLSVTDQNVWHQVSVGIEGTEK